MQLLTVNTAVLSQIFSLLSIFIGMYFEISPFVFYAICALLKL